MSGEEFGGSLSALGHEHFKHIDHSGWVVSGFCHEVISHPVGFGFMLPGVAKTVENIVEHVSGVKDVVVGPDEGKDDDESELSLHRAGVLVGPVHILNVDDFVPEDADDFVFGFHFVEHSGVEKDRAAGKGEGIDFF